MTVSVTGDADSAQAGKSKSSASTTPSPSSDPPATGCAGAACASLEPAATVCSQDAVTAYIGRKYGASVELRYSPHCRAAWAKMSNTSPGDRIIITPKKGDTEEHPQQYGHDAHTRMVPATRSEDAHACTAIQDRGTVCATTSVTATDPSPQTAHCGRDLPVWGV
ncbi:DUF2690 domain-containing protein [Streptomyces sp. NPDC054804]